MESNAQPLYSLDTKRRSSYVATNLLILNIEKKIILNIRGGSSILKVKWTLFYFEFSSQMSQRVVDVNLSRNQNHHHLFSCRDEREKKPHCDTAERSASEQVLSSYQRWLMNELRIHFLNLYLGFPLNVYILTHQLFFHETTELFVFFLNVLIKREWEITSPGENWYAAKNKKNSTKKEILGLLDIIWTRRRMHCLLISKLISLSIVNFSSR